MKIRVIPFRRESAAWNLALEEALFLRAKEKLIRQEEVQPIVKMYGFSKPSVILGHRQVLEEIDAQYCEDQKVDVTMRTTGGGSVYLGKWDIQYSLLLNQPFNKELLGKINFKIKSALQNNGYPAHLKKKNDHSIVRVSDRGTIFDAQRRYKNLLLHHGTTLVDDSDYDHMPRALKATNEELETLQKGNLWLKEIRQLKEKNLVRSYQKEFTKDDSFSVKDYTEEEIKLARNLYKKHYSNPESFKDGKRKFGICYLTNTEYDMDLYAEEDQE